jgi:ligand-binding SRPBCC domain-containing protein
MGQTHNDHKKDWYSMKIGILGTGAIGKTLIQRLSAAGHDGIFGGSGLQPHFASLYLRGISGLMTSIEQRMQIAAPIQRCFDLARSIEVHLLGTERTGERAVGGVTTGLIGPNEYVRWRAKHLGVRQYLTSKITAFDSPYYFQDTMVAGAFKFFQHDHYFHAITNSQTEMRDRLTFAAPIPVLGNTAERLFLKRYMDRFLRRRNEIVKRVAESDRWQDFIPQK